MNQTRKIGDRVWHARFIRNVEVKSLCPICFGKLKVTLILGNDDQVTLPCDYCGKGHPEPTGYVIDYQSVAEAVEVIITNIEISENQYGIERRYGFDNRSCLEDDIFNTEEEALMYAKEKATIQQKEEGARIEYLKKSNKASYSWNAGYWLSQANRARKDAANYDQRAVLCKAKKALGIQ